MLDVILPIGVLAMLIDRLEPRRRWPDALGGWILLVAGIALAVAALFEDNGDRTEIFEVAAVTVLIGAATLAYAWWVERATPRA